MINAGASARICKPTTVAISEAMRAFEVAEDDFLEGCACFGECEAPYDVDADDSSGSCPCVQLNAIVKSGSAPLFECHASCSCGPACRLRATQRRGEGGCKVPPTIRLRYMGAKGWGAYPTDAVPAGTFVADYTGEVLPVHEAKRRMLAYDRDGLNYVLTTQEFFQGGKQMCQTIVDATTCGNESRFFNHCCDPNLSVFVIRRGSFLRPHLAFFTKTRVEAGEELTYDYGATGSAGGTISQADEDQRNPEPQSIRKRGSEKSKKSKLGGKASLNKTVGASPSTSSLMPQESSTPDVSLRQTTTAVLKDTKDPLRASAPAGPTSALDKAMSFLNKYKQGASNVDKAKGAITSRKNLDVANTTIDEDQMDVSLSSDSDAVGRTSGRKATSRLKASRGEPGLEPRAAAAGTGRDLGTRPLTLSDVRSSGRFGTAKELGISESVGLDGPKAAVSPVNIQHNRSMNNSEGGMRYHAEGVSRSEYQSSGVRLVVNIPGDSSIYDSPAKHESESNIESVGSAVAEVLEMQSPKGEEVSEAEPWLGSLNSDLGVCSETDPGGCSGLYSPNLEQQHGSARNLDQDSRGACGRGFARSPPDRSALGKVMSVNDLAKALSPPQASPNERDRGINAADGSGSEGSGRIRGSYAAEGAETEDYDDEEDDYSDDDFEDQDVLMESTGETAPITEGQDTNSAPTAGPPSHVSRVGQSRLRVDGAGNNQEREALSRPVEAWSMPPADKEDQRSLSGTPVPGTTPGPSGNGDIDRRDELIPSGTMESWVERPAPGSCADNEESNAPAATGGVAGTPFPNTDQSQKQGFNSARGTGKGETRKGRLSKRGVLIDRSTEASDPIPPPDTEVKIIARVEAVASVEYARDPESGLNLRSCGTQMVGNSAAVQANIIVPADANVRQEDDDSSDGGSDAQGGADPAGSSRNGGDAHLHDRENAEEKFGGRDATRTPAIPSVLGGPAYLETFLDDMAKSQAESCHIWQQVLEMAMPRHVPAFPDEKVRCEEKTGTAGGVNDAEPRNRDDAPPKGQERYQGPSEADLALHSIMTATQDSYRRQLADMRDNLSKIRYRAEVAGRQAYAHNYESVSDVRDYLARARPLATRPAGVFMTVDPSLTREEAETLAEGTPPFTD
eukprot:g7831.t1